MARGREKLSLANGPTPKIVPQNDEPPHVYLGNNQTHSTELEEEFVRCTGARYRCFSFVYLSPKAIYWCPRTLESYRYNITQNSHIMLDSGAFSFHQFVAKQRDQGKVERLKDETVQLYVDFCRKEAENCDFVVTFDYRKECPLIWEMTKYLESQGIKPVPVYHGDSPVEWLKKYLDAGYQRVSLGVLAATRKNPKNLKFYLDQCFRIIEPYKVKVHGLAMTSLSTMFGYPWTSVDSSSWTKVACKGGIFTLDKNRGSVPSTHISLTGGLKSSTKSASSLSPSALKSLRDYTEELGWDFDLLRRSLTYRSCFNGWIFAHLNEYKKDYLAQRSIKKWGQLL